MTIKGVTIGDRFHPHGKGKIIVAEVVDILECKSLKTGAITGHICLAQNMNGLATNTYDVSFTTVLRFKIAHNNPIQ